MSKLSTTLAALGLVSTLGLSTLPLASYAETKNADYANGEDDAEVSAEVKVTVGESISLVLSDVSGSKYNPETSVLNLGEVTADGITTGSIKATVLTNAEDGYNLVMTTSNAALKKGESDSIPGSNNVGAGVSAWNYYTGATSGTVNYTTVKSSNDLASNEKNESDTIVTFGVSVAADLAAGEYKDTVTFTASVAE